MFRRVLSSRCVLGMTAALVLGGLATHSFAQLGKQQGLVDPNVATEKELLAVPNMTEAIVKTIIEKRPFNNIVELNTHLLAQGLTAEKLTQSYGKMFIAVNLNLSPREEILLIPGAGARMVREFDEYKPYPSYERFRREIGKYVNETEVARLEQYTFIPVLVNTGSDEDFKTIPGVTDALVAKIKAGRPYASMEALRAELVKATNEKEAGRIERYIALAAPAAPARGAGRRGRGPAAPAAPAAPATSAPATTPAAR
jgi:DNA uptake protein ComE-like DNA-binding protein